MKNNLLFFIIILFLFLSVVTVKVLAMSSSNYQIQTDSINFGGTENSSSNGLNLSDTLGEVGTGFSSSTNYSLSSGYRMMQDSYISISSASDVSLPGISGLAGGQSTSSSTWLVKTDNYAGYSLYVRASTSPALKTSSTGYFSDYIQSGATPDYNFNILATQSLFGFSAEGSDVSQSFLDNGSQCGIGVIETTDKCWVGFSTTTQTVSHRNSSNHPNGSTTTLKYRAEIGANKIQDAGSYSATIIVTAITL